MIADVCQRWRRRCATFVPPSERFDARRYEVAAIPDDTTARAFVEAHHYSRSYPAARWRFGLYERGALLGVAVFSVPVRAEVLKPFPHEIAATELGRFVLLDPLAFNAETWFLAQVARLLRREGPEGFVMFSDPHPRTTAEGEVVFAGHVGGIYQAFSARLLGRAHPDTIHLLPDGRVLPRRALVKVRKAEKGWRTAVDRLVEAGATPPETTRADALTDWLARELPRVTRRERHPGNWKYAFGITSSARRGLPPSLPYPRVTVSRARCVPFAGRAAS